MLETLIHWMMQAVNLFLHLDVHLNQVILDYGSWTYGFLFLIIFCETGLVVTPILPGDSLLFAAGTFAATGSLRLAICFLLLVFAAVLGDNVNYLIGRTVGPKVWEMNSPFLKRQYLERTQAFYDRYGGKTIIMARFAPIVRTFAPFLAGVGKMPYARFAPYTVVGSILWIGICLSSGYLFGNIPMVRRNFSLVVLGVVFVSILPAVLAALREKFRPAEAGGGKGLPGTR